MLQYKYTFSLRAVHPTKDLQTLYDELSLISDVTPGRIWKVGESRKTPKGDQIVGEYKESYFYFRFFEKPTSSDIETLPKAIWKAVDQLQTKKELLLEHVASGGQLEFFIGWYFETNSGDIFDLKLLKKITELGIELNFDIYPSGNSVRH